MTEDQTFLPIGPFVPVNSSLHYGEVVRFRRSGPFEFRSTPMTIEHTCEYCRTVSEGGRCPSCGAPRQKPRETNQWGPGYPFPLPF